tara:strand:+ start:10972 stop:11397 length:426 start_codon:yes stop_codon:yes gene_type:complete
MKMKPIRVEAGENSEVQELLEKAQMLEKMIEESGNNDVHFEDVSGTNVRAQHYWTNQQPLPVPETVSKKLTVDKNPPGLNYHAGGNTHQTESTLGMHLNQAGGEGRPAALKKSELLGAWHEDDPHSVSNLIKKVEDLSRHL